MHVCVCARNEKSCLPSLVSKFSHEPCWVAHEKTSPGMHQDTIDNPSHITSSLSVFCAALSAPRPACLSRADSLQHESLSAGTARIWILSEPLIQTLWLQRVVLPPAQPPRLSFFSPAAATGGFSSSAGLDLRRGVCKKIRVPSHVHVGWDGTVWGLVFRARKRLYLFLIL